MITNIGKDKFPKISVVTVSFNQAEFIKQNIESVLQQNYPNLEHIVVDGGSTDGTIEILKSYPHLKWTSEPDRGQTHALNKGFSRASGDVIAWLNSDDWYPEGVLHTVAEELRTQAIVIGACQVTDKLGNPTEYVANIGRTWFDILKYWIFFSSPSQPSIFFRREVLSEFQISEGVYLDEALDFCMDYEFWLRMARTYPLTKYIPKVLSYCRTYDTNKTGRDMDSVYREMSRVFARYSSLSCKAERKISVIIPFVEFSSSIVESVNSLTRQTLKDCEVVLVDHCQDQKIAKQHRRSVLDLEKTVPLMNVRYVRSLETDLLKTLQMEFKSTPAPFVAVLTPGTVVGETFCFDVVNLFRHDIIGMALPLKNQTNLACLQQSDSSGRKSLNLQNIFSAPWMPICFVARTVALQELNGFKSLESECLAMRELVLRMMYRGWNVNVDNVLEVQVVDHLASMKNLLLAQNANFYAAKIICDLQEEYESDQFGQIRAQHGFALTMPEGMVKDSRQLLSNAPPHVFSDAACANQQAGSSQSE